MKRFLAGFLLVIVSAIVAYTVIEKDPHEFGVEECPKCHVDSSEKPKALTAPVTRLCLPCHKQMDKRSSHPVDKVPELVRVPSDLPLTGGRITCITCHNVHEKRESVLRQKTYLLRRPSAGREFCVSCHVVKNSSGHVDVVTTAHIGSKYTVNSRSALLDPMSMNCIGCHDGSLARPVNSRIGQGIWEHNQGAHPIGVDYEECRMRRGELHPFSTVSKKLTFYNGKIGCGTCHDMYSRNPGKLVMSNDRSKLCFFCHNK